MIKFKDGGWTARISEDFTAANIGSLLRAIASTLTPARPVIISYDSRFLSDKWAEETVKVFHQAGFQVWLTEREAPLPAIEWEVRDRKAAGAVVITGGNLSAEYSGIKIFPSDSKLADRIGQNLALSKEPALSSSGSSERFELRDRYLAYLEGMADRPLFERAGLKILVDPLFGSGRGYLDRLFSRLGCTVTEIHDHRDVLFGGMVPDPLENEMKELKAEVGTLRHDLGIGLSADGVSYLIIDPRKKVEVKGSDGLLGLLKAVERLLRGNVV